MRPEISKHLPSRKPLSMPSKPKRWSHQDELAAGVGKSIQISYLAGPNQRSMEGLLLASDQFTIKVRNSLQVERVIFKHAIFGFTFDV